MPFVPQNRFIILAMNEQIVPIDEAREELACLVNLHSLTGMKQGVLKKLVQSFGSARAVCELQNERALYQIKGISLETLRAIISARNRLPLARRYTDRMLKMGVHAITSSKPDFPRSISELTFPPWLVYMLGNQEFLDNPSVGIVGSSKPSDKGRAIAREIARRLGRAGITVVSGMAKGIDTAAHEGVMEAGGNTVCVIPTGILRFHAGGKLGGPHEFMKRGCVISECPPDAEWSAPAAVARNRIIAALSSALLVVETKVGGGAMHTFRSAQELGRPVFVLKFRKPPESATGNNTAVGMGATAISRLAESYLLIEAARSFEGRETNLS